MAFSFGAGLIGFSAGSSLPVAAVAAGVRPGGGTAQEVYTPPELQNVEEGTVVIRAHERALCYIEPGGTARRYRVAVPKSGMEWSGKTYVTGKQRDPAWEAPAIVRHDHPDLPRFIEGGNPRNPMGAAAITLARTEIAIHGTTASMRQSIGSAASYGCIRMLDEDALDLYNLVDIDTPVLMLP